MSGERGEEALLIRALEIGDAESLAWLTGLPGYRYGTMRLPYLTVASSRHFLEKLGPDDLMLGAFLGDQLAGTAGLQRRNGRRRHVAVLGMGVADHVTGRGIGTALLTAILDAADRWLDLRRIELTVFADNHRATALYGRFGFEREGAMRAYAFRDGDYADAVAMARLSRL